MVLELLDRPIPLAGYTPPGRPAPEEEAPAPEHPDEEEEEEK